MHSNWQGHFASNREKMGSPKDTLHPRFPNVPLMCPLYLMSFSSDFENVH